MTSPRSTPPNSVSLRDLIALGNVLCPALSRTRCRMVQLRRSLIPAMALGEIRPRSLRASSPSPLLLLYHRKPWAIARFAALFFDWRPGGSWPWIAESEGILERG